uniref:Response regulator n=1 Tax=Desulfobacca acetoxidans TaxID=60893 RepID=A0A7C3Z9Z0_9BACT
MLAEEILVINDGSLLLKMMSVLLQNKGYHLSLTDSPEEALVLLSTRHIVLVVLKLNGHQADRLAVLHMVKELSRDSRLIVMGEAMQLPAEIFEVEADDYILLPCRIAEVWRRLTRCLESPARSEEFPEEGTFIEGAVLRGEDGTRAWENKPPATPLN